MRRSKKNLFILLASLVVVALGIGFIFRDTLYKRFFEPTPSNLPTGIADSSQVEQGFRIIAENLAVPWDIAVLPDGDLLVTERAGTIRRIGGTPFEYTISEVRQTAEGGLLGIALDPDFAQTQHVYVYMTVDGQTALENQVVRYTFSGTDFRDKQVIFSGILGANTHDGGKIAFGPDGLLYIATGDANIEELAQDRSSLNGKILRINKDGSIPSDNPFGTAIYSYGHRNPQGLAWDGNGNLWATEHGRSGVQSGFDELNQIVKGGNFGWPIIEGSETKEGMIAPVAHSGSDETWAPGGLAYHDGALYFSGLRGRRLYEARITASGVALQTHFANEFGRLRAMTIADGILYFSSSNRDGRGQPTSGDDKIFSLPAVQLTTN